MEPEKGKSLPGTETDSLNSDEQEGERDEEELNREYFRHHLRKEHPYADEDKIEEAVNKAFTIEEIRENLEMMRKLEEKLRKEDPEWEGGWGLPTSDVD